MKSFKQKSVQIALTSIIGLSLCAAIVSNFSDTVKPVLAQSSNSLPIAAVTASTSDSNLPANAIDNNLSTRWSGLGQGAWIKFDLGTTATVNKIGIAFYRGSLREAYFSVEVSTDNSTWKKVLEEESNSDTNQLQEFSFPSTQARYVRIMGYGNDENDWNSFTEVRIFGSGTTVPNPSTSSRPSPSGIVPLPPTGFIIDETNDTYGWK